MRDSKPGSTNPADGMAARLEGGDPDTRVGTAIMLQVMPGDKFEISTDSYYEGENQTGEESGAAPLVSSLMSALMGGGTYAGTPISELPENMQIISGLLSDGALPEFLQDIQVNDNPLAPKAHLNYLFFDSKLQLVPGLSGSIQVQGGGTTGWHNSGSVTIGPGTVGNNVIQPAYVIIYVDNQTIGKNVWFDNVHVEHYTSKLLEEDHYYPFGLTIHLDQAAQSNLPAQPYKLTTKELETSFDLNIYDFGARRFDMTRGQWTSIDPLADKYYSYSPYNYCMNNPILFNDPDGRNAKQTGSGTKEDPLVITAKYFYPKGSLSETEIGGLGDAINDYNSLGLQQTKDKAGNKVFVKYQLSQEGVDDVQSAFASTEFTDESGEVRFYGNIAGINNEGSDDYGESNFRTVNINREKINATEKGDDVGKRTKSSWIHEIGHNLGLLHEDGTPTMEQRASLERSTQISDGGSGNLKLGVYPYVSPKITPILLKKIGTQREKSEGRIYKEKKN